MTEITPSLSEPSVNHDPGSTRRLLIGILIMLIAALVGISLYAISQSRTVTLVTDGTARSLQTRAATVSALLAEQNLILNPADRITPAVETALYDDLVIRLDRAHPVYIQIDDAAMNIDTIGSTAAEILANIGEEVGDDARIFINGEEVDSSRLMINTGEAINHLVVLHPRPFSVVIEPAFGDEAAERLSLCSSASTIGAALYDVGIDLYLADIVTPALSSPLSSGMEIHIQRAQPVTIAVDGTALTTRILGGTVADALSAASIALIGLDYTIPDLNAPVTANTIIRVIRVKENLITETRPVPFETIYQEFPDLDAGSERIIQEGRAGVEQIVTRIRLEDGEETGRTIIRQTLLAAPQEQIIARGS